MSSKSRSRSRSASRSPKYSRRNTRDDSMSPIRTASGANLRTPKNYNSANRNFQHNNNFGYRNYGYNNRGYYNQRGYYPRWNRGRGNWRGQHNYRNQWNDRRRYNSRSERSHSRSRSRSYDSRDSRSRSSSYGRSKSRSRSREEKRRRTRSRSNRKSRSPPPKVADKSKTDEMKSPAKQEEAKPATITVPSTTELVTEPEPVLEDVENEEQKPHFAETSAFTRSRWETPDGSPGKREATNMDLSQDEIFDRWDDDKLREYLLRSKGKKIRKESKKSDAADQEKSKKKKKKAKRDSRSGEARTEKSSGRSSSHDASSDSSFSPIHKAPSKQREEGQEKYLPPEYDDDDNQSVEMQENSPPPKSAQYYSQEQKQVETVQYPFEHIKSTPVQPPAKPSPVPPSALPSIGQMQVLGPDGKPMRLVPVSIPGPDGNMIQVMQLQPIVAVSPPKPTMPEPPQPVKPPPIQHKAPPPTAYPPPHQYNKNYGAPNVSAKIVPDTQEMNKNTSENLTESNNGVQQSYPFSSDDHTINLKKIEMSQKQSRKQDVLKTRFKPRPAGSWASELTKKGRVTDKPKEKSMEPEKEQFVGQSIPSLVDPSGQPSYNKDEISGQKIATITGAKSSRVVLEPERPDPVTEWSTDVKYTNAPRKQDIAQEVKTTVAKDEKVQHVAIAETALGQNTKITRESSTKSFSKEPDSSENEMSHQKSRAGSSDESVDGEVVKRKKDKKKKKKNKKKQREDAEGSKKKKKKQKEKSIEKSVILSLEHESIKSKKDLKVFEEMNKKGKADNLVRVVDESLPLSHVRAMVPRKADVVLHPIFSHIVTDDLASSSSYEDRFVSLFGSSSTEPTLAKEERIDLTKKSVRKLKVNVRGPRAVTHMTALSISERFQQLKDDMEPDMSSQKISMNISGLSGRSKVSESRSRSRSASSSASSESPKKNKKKKKTRKSSSRSTSRSVSLPAAYGGDDDKSPGRKRHRDDSDGETRRRTSRDRYSRSPSSSADERDRGRRPMYYNRNNQGYYYNNNRGRGFYQNRNRGWYNNRGGYRGRWNNWNQGWNRNQNWRNQRFRDRYSRDRSRSRSRSDRSSSREDRRSRSPRRDKSPKRLSVEDKKNNEQHQKTAGQGENRGSDIQPPRNDIFVDEKPPGVD